MSSTPAAAATLRRVAARRVRASALSVRHPELLGLLALAAVLYLWALDRNGMANDYYAAAVRSMSTSWHAFLYGSFDPAGVMTVDKPPLALWVQALSVRVFGFSSWSMLVPQALMGVATVGLVYDLTRRRFGRVAGSVAGLALVLTPITVAISRHNNPDALLVLCLAGALWCLVRGLEDGRTRWLVLCGVSVGLGFEAKMAAALLVVPALAAAWLWVAPRGRRAALRQLAAGGGAMVAVGGAWPLLVALTPAADRPWISGTADNSIWSLITGYNGLGRISGQAGGPQAFGGGGGASSLFGGAPGPLRLVEASLGGQSGWLVGFALVAIAAGLAASRLRRGDPATGWLIGAGGAFLTIAVTFSFASGIFHPYYVSELAPFTAALVGAGCAQALADGRRGRIVGPLALGAGLATVLAVAHDAAGVPGWTSTVAIALAIALAVPAAVALALPNVGVRLRRAALAVGLAALMAAPAVWAVQTLGHPTNGTFPAGGPSERAGFGGPGGPGGRRGQGRFAAGGARGFGAPPPAGVQGTLPPRPMAGGSPGGGFAGGAGGPGGADSGAEATAIAYARAHGGGTIATSSQTGASAQVIAGADVAGIGGFSGRESEVTPAWLADAVDAGRIRWVLTTGGGFGGRADARVGSRSVMTIATQACTKTSVSGLYDCAGKASALRATANAS
jgi:4-amino-4-deoxy-L-arabinose transferase-like glycosyltransferase